MKRKAIPGDQDGPRWKRIAHKTKQDDQVHGAAATKEDEYIPQQLPPCQPPSPVMILRKAVACCKEFVWSGTIEFHDGSLSLSNGQRQTRFSSHCSVHSDKKMNSVNWPKQLKMHRILFDDYIKIKTLGKKSERYRVGLWLCMDQDDYEMFLTAFFPTTTTSVGCVLLEYTPSTVCVLFLRNINISWSVPFYSGWIVKFSNPVVEFLRDKGIIPHGITEQVLAKENARLKEELLKKDKMLVEQQMLHQEKVEMTKTLMAEKEEEQVRVERKMDVMEKQITDKERALRKKHLALMKTESALVVKETALMQKEVDKNELQQENAELVKEVHTMQSVLADIQKQFKCSICRRLIIKATTLICGHSFCLLCIQDWLKHNKEATCPNCRGPVKTVVPSVVIDNSIEVIKQTVREESVRETEGEFIGDTLERRSQSMPEESDDESSPVTSPSSSASSYCRAPSSIERMFSSSSDSD